MVNGFCPNSLREFYCGMEWNLSYGFLSVLGVMAISLLVVGAFLTSGTAVRAIYASVNATPIFVIMNYFGYDMGTQTVMPYRLATIVPSALMYIGLVL